ncbi:hypothetical protein LXL04_029601 [Taraxacum kok-saghyz]
MLHHRRWSSASPPSSSLVFCESAIIVAGLLRDRSRRRCEISKAPIRRCRVPTLRDLQSSESDAADGARSASRLLLPVFCFPIDKTDC